MNSAGKPLQSLAPSIPPLPTWDGPEYVRVSPGRYDAVATRYQGPQWVRRYRRWSLMIEFELLCESKRVGAFFNMGNNPARSHTGPQSRYFRAWAMANGGRPLPKQMLDPNVFLDGQIFEVEVTDSGTDADGQTKEDALIYSRVTEVLSIKFRNDTNHPVRQSSQSTDSRNHESEIMQSRNQESTNQGGRVLPLGAQRRKAGSGAHRPVFGKRSRQSHIQAKASPQPGDGNAHAKRTRRAGTSVPAQAESFSLNSLQ
jgi:hypothetical protein